MYIGGPTVRGPGSGPPRGTRRGPSRLARRPPASAPARRITIATTIRLRDWFGCGWSCTRRAPRRPAASGVRWGDGRLVEQWRGAVGRCTALPCTARRYTRRGAVQAAALPGRSILRRCTALGDAVRTVRRLVAPHGADARRKEDLRDAGARRSSSPTCAAHTLSSGHSLLASRDVTAPGSTPFGARPLLTHTATPGARQRQPSTRLAARQECFGN